MKAMKLSAIMTAAIVGLTGCAGTQSKQIEKASISIQSVGLSDSSGTLVQEQVTTRQKRIENDVRHQNSYLSLNRELADQLMQEAHLSGASVALTDTSIYVAVDSWEIPDKDTQSRIQLLSQYQNPASEAGLFGSGAGGQMDWVTAKPLSSQSINTIKHVLTRIYPDSPIYISTNALFVKRMMFYDMQQQKNKRMDTFLHEFNTMVQYSFPSSQ